MNLLFLAFANSEEDPLPSLTKEHDELYSMLSPRVASGHFQIHRDATTTTGKIMDSLSLFKDQIEVFHYSGHAGNNILELEDQTANAQGIAQFLAQCPKLKLVVLNGCSTGGQVDRLLQLESAPIIIATSAPVGDQTATEFSVRFYQALADDFSTIEEAFDIAIAAAQTLAPNDLSPKKGFFKREEDTADEPLWGIYYSSDINLDWRLPDFPMGYTASEYQPNKHLINQLIKYFAKYHPDSQKIVTDMEIGMEPSLLDKREAVLKCMPHPISEQLRKLIVKEQAGSGHVFYDRLGHDRLKQMVDTYNTVIELLAFIQMAQIWDEVAADPGFQLPPETLKAIKAFYTLPRKDRPNFDWLPLNQALDQALKSNQKQHFMKEMEDTPDFFAPGGTFASASQFMHSLKKRMVQLRRAKLDDSEAAPLCMIAEEKIADIIGHMNFFSQYTLASIKNIDVIKYRHIKQPRFKHHIVRLVQRFVGLAEEMEVREGFMDTASVLLLPVNNADKRYLTISPFIIDKNAFVEKSNVSKIHYFDRYEKAMDAYSYKHIYKPDDVPLVVRDDGEYRIVKAQFNAFARTIFKTEMRSL